MSSNGCIIIGVLVGIVVSYNGCIIISLNSMIGSVSLV